MFASVANKKLPRFISWHPCKDAMHIDAFTCNWGTIRGFLFAPFHCLASVLKKCLDDEVENMCGVFPLWPTKTWWPTLMRLSRGKIVELKGAGQRLALLWGPEVTHPMGSEINFRQFVYELLLRRKVPKSQAAHIAKNAWRKSTYRKKMPPLQQWFAFTEKEGKNVHELGTTNILAFLEFLHLEYNSYNMLRRGAALLRLLCRLIGKPVSQDDNYIIDKVMQATFNTHPPKIKRTNSTWDVNILLDHLVSLGPNSSITCTNKLAGKLALQLLITQMSRSSEIAQLQLSTMRLLPGALQFELKRPTKTFTHKNVRAQAQSNLQTMTIKEFPGNKLLCPLTTLMAYMDRTKFVRHSIDHLFVLVTTSVPHRASQVTIVRWCKDILRDAGLGTYTLHSTRGASSTSAFLMGTTNI